MSIFANKNNSRPTRVARFFLANQVGIVVLSALSLLTGCGVESQEVDRSDAIRYYLNQRDFEPAIVLLKQHIIANPTDDGSKVLLASAYSGSVGINTIDCFEVLRPKLFDKPLAEKSLSENELSRVLFGDIWSVGSGKNDGQTENEKDADEEKKRKATLAIEKELLKFASQSSEAMEVAFRLPHVPKEKRDRISLSIAILNDIKETSDQYLTAQLYSGVLSLVQFMNYFRDAVPPSTGQSFNSHAWYISIYCQLDLTILMPNLSRSIDYLSATFVGFYNAGRRSDNPVYTNLIEGKERLHRLNANYLMNQDFFEFADWSMRASKSDLCEP